MLWPFQRTGPQRRRIYPHGRTAGSWHNRLVPFGTGYEGYWYGVRGGIGTGYEGYWYVVRGVLVRGTRGISTGYEEGISTGYEGYFVRGTKEVFVRGTRSICKGCEGGPRGGICTGSTRVRVRYLVEEETNLTHSDGLVKVSVGHDNKRALSAKFEGYAFHIRGGGKMFNFTTDPCTALYQ